MPDADHVWGGDLSFSDTGDLAMMDGPDLTRQRLLRRLLTNPGDYLDHLEYGAGLPAFVGEPVHPLSIKGVVRQQSLLEASVAETPEPTVDLSADSLGTVNLVLTYHDEDGNQQQLNVGLRE